MNEESKKSLDADHDKLADGGGTFDLTKLSDALTLHNQPQRVKLSKTVQSSPFKPDERGRLKQTQVLDHIIKMKRDKQRRAEALVEQREEEAHQYYIDYINEKHSVQKNKSKIKSRNNDNSQLKLPTTSMNQTDYKVASKK